MFGAELELAQIVINPEVSDDEKNKVIRRLETIKNDNGIGLCNITKCCTEVCPENIAITDNAIIPMKERVVDEYYDPLKWIWRKLTGKTN